MLWGYSLCLINLYILSIIYNLIIVLGSGGGLITCTLSNMDFEIKLFKYFISPHFYQKIEMCYYIWLYLTHTPCQWTEGIMITNGWGQKSSNYCEEAWHKAISSWSRGNGCLDSCTSVFKKRRLQFRLSLPEDMQNSIVFQGYFSYKFLLTISYS